MHQIWRYNTMSQRRAKRRRPTSEKLVQALTAAGAPSGMIARAEAGYYDDYRSPLGLPIYQLVQDCEAVGTDELRLIAAHARDGVFDGQKWEADAWAKSTEGRKIFQQLRMNR
jgi:hypothetical protein